MIVLIVGATGQFGLRMIPALLAVGHKPIAFVRSRQKFESLLPAELLSRISIVEGDAENSQDITQALLDHKCAALVCCAGAPAPRDGKGGSRQGHISQVVAHATVKAGQQRGSPLKAWFITGMVFMAQPGRSGRTYHEDIPWFRPEHRLTHETLKDIPTSQLEWSVLCPALMPTLYEPVRATQPPSTARLHPSVEVIDTPRPWRWIVRLAFFLPGKLKLLGMVLLVLGRMRVKMEDVCGWLAGEMDRGQYNGKSVNLREIWRFC